MPDAAPNSPNFAFLAGHQPLSLLVTYAEFAERYVFEDPNTALLKLGQFSRRVAELIAAQVGAEIDKSDDQANVLHKVAATGRIPRRVLDQLHELRKARNQAMYDHAADQRFALYQLQNAHNVAIWFYQAYFDPKLKVRAFRPPPTPEAATQELAADLERLREQVVAIDLQKEEAQRIAADERARRTELERRDAQVQTTANQRVAEERRRREAAEEELRRTQARQAARNKSDEESRREYAKLVESARASDQETHERLQEMEQEFRAGIERIRREVRDQGRAIGGRAIGAPVKVPNNPRSKLPWAITAFGLIVVLFAMVALLGIWLTNRKAAEQTATASPGHASAADTKAQGRAVVGQLDDGTAIPVLAATDGPGLRAHKKGLVRVKGRVTSTHLTVKGTVLYLHFGPFRADCLSAKILHHRFGEWPGGVEGIKRAYEGKTIAFTGEVEVYQDQPQIAINSPSDVTVTSD